MDINDLKKKKHKQTQKGKNRLRKTEIFKYNIIDVKDGKRKYEY